MYTDESLQGLGGVLAQVQDSCEWVIANASCSLWPTENNPHNYRSFKLELLALVWVLTKKGADSNPLAYLDTEKLGALEQRWVAHLALFN